MQEVYVLQHVHTLSQGSEDIKMIGVYSTQALAQAAQDRLSHRPGFRDAAEGFSIDMYTLDIDHWTEGYITWSNPREEISDEAAPGTL